MIRIILFLFLIGAAALGLATIADLGGDVSLQWGAWRADPPLLVVLLVLVLTVFALILLWALIRAIWRTPGRIRHARHERRLAKGRHAITQGLIAIGTGDHFAARHHADVARRLAHQDPLALLLHAQSAQLNGDRDGAQRAFHTLAEREDTRVLGLRGLFVEAQRRDDVLTAVAMAEEALKVAPASAWASHAVLGFRCSRSDWDGALQILENDLASGLIDPAPYRRQRGVLLTARALDLETGDRDQSRESVMEAVKLAPTLVPAVTLAAKFLSESNQTRRAMRIVEAAWMAQPHPDLADAYAHIRLGDSAVQRLSRVESLAAKSPSHIESALAVARAAIDASEFAKARAVLAPFTETPTQRVALLMAELERTEHGDSGSARAWMLRAVRAAHDPVWTADGYVSDRWRPVSPVTGRIDAFQWLTPLSALPSEKSKAIDAEIADDAMLAAPRAELPSAPAAASQDNSPAPAPISLPPQTPASAAVGPPVFRPRREIEKIDSARLQPVIPIVRAPDDPGVPDDAPPDDEFADSMRPDQMQAGGWRGFLSRLVS
ncbi:MAG: heme biosynthesis protein HemY [Afipia sp.]|nr:heme biosynthesis protein HemY [Afipia sp.]